MSGKGGEREGTSVRWWEFFWEEGEDRWSAAGEAKGIEGKESMNPPPSYHPPFFLDKFIHLYTQL